MLSIGAHLPAAFFARCGRACVRVRNCPSGRAQVCAVAVVAVSTRTGSPLLRDLATAAASSTGPVEACSASEALPPAVVDVESGCDQSKRAAVRAASTRPMVKDSRVRVRTKGLRNGSADTVSTPV